VAGRPGCWCSTWSSSAIATSRPPAARRDAAFVADRGDAAHRLDHAAARHLSGPFSISRAALQRLVAGGRVRVNGQPASRPAQRLHAGDLVQVDLPRAPERPRPSAEPMALEILHEDDDLLVLVKPPGMVAHPSHAHRSGTLLNALLWHSARAPHGAARWEPRLVQRLDKDTSGLLVVAKSSAAHAALQGERARFVKEYLAVVWGRPLPARGSIDRRLGRDPLDRRRVMARAGGAAALTRYHVLQRSRGEARGLSLVACELVTGRTHQLRVHLAAQGWPLVGDVVYGQPPRTRIVDVAVDRAARAFARQALHAWRLQFAHPRSGDVLRFEAPMPPDLAGLIALAGLGSPLDISNGRHRNE
jgi:23S rRNA pseudouridine1911/1915/1917 synthase